MSSEELTRLQEEIAELLKRVKRPKKAVVTAGMPYANGPLHLGHLAGAHVPADIYSRWLKLLIGQDNVLFVCGTDDHGSTSEVVAKREGLATRDLIGSIHLAQSKTMDKYSIGLDVYTGTSRPENFEGHKTYCRDFLRKLYDNNMLEKKTSEQWFDVEMELFLPDRYVSGTCPKCGYDKAYSEECDSCGARYNPSELKEPKSAVSETTPVLKETDHWYLNMWKVVDQLKGWLETKQRTWRKSILLEVMNNVHPSVVFPNTFEKAYKTLKEQLPKHKSRYAPGKKIVVQFNNLEELEKGCHICKGVVLKQSCSTVGPIVLLLVMFLGAFPYPMIKTLIWPVKRFMFGQSL